MRLPFQKKVLTNFPSRSPFTRLRLIKSRSKAECCKLPFSYDVTVCYILALSVSAVLKTAPKTFLLKFRHFSSHIRNSFTHSGLTQSLDQRGYGIPPWRWWQFQTKCTSIRVLLACSESFRLPRFPCADGRQKRSLRSTWCGSRQTRKTNLRTSKRMKKSRSSPGPMTTSPAVGGELLLKWVFYLNLFYSFLKHTGASCWSTVLL